MKYIIILSFFLYSCNSTIQNQKKNSKPNLEVKEEKKLDIKETVFDSIWNDISGKNIFEVFKNSFNKNL